MAIETNGENSVVVRNYTSNFDIKELMQEKLIPDAFPQIPVNKLNLGFPGLVGEMMTQAIEDSAATASLMINEAFITRSVLPDSIYSAASLYDLGYSFAEPSRCSFAVELWLPDVLDNSKKVRNTNTMRYYLDKDTKVVVGDNAYRFDYDVIIDWQMIDGKRVFNIYYDIDETNCISDITNKYIKHQTTSVGWLVLFVTLKEFNRKTDNKPLTDNLVTTNSDIEIKWTGQIAGLDLVYITPQGERLPMKKKNIYTDPEMEPFCWYKFKSDNIITLSFSSNSGYFVPAFNSKVEWTIYTCRGKAADFDVFDNKSGVPVQRTGSRFSYNASTKIVAICYGGSWGGLNKGDIELLRDDVKMYSNTVGVLSTDHDLQLWFDRFGKRYGTKAKFFKRRDDPSGTLFSQFIAVKNDTYVYPTNTLSIDVKEEQFDYINRDAAGVAKEFIIKPGHLWEYADEEGFVARDKVRMVEGVNGMAMITDEALPVINSDRPFMFVNPFYIKIHRDPTTSINYNYLINDTSWPDDVYSNPDSFYQFQLATFVIKRSISSKENDKYKLQVQCVPVITEDKTLRYITGVGKDYPVENNNLRMVLILRSRLDGETGYIEMTPTEERKGGSIVFEAEFSVYDNIDANKMLEVDMNATPNMFSLISTGERKGRVFIDSTETSFHFACLMRDNVKPTITNLFGNDSFKGYLMTNRFCNASRDLTLYKPMSMMRSEIVFDGENGMYHINASLIPFLKYDMPLDDEKMMFFIQAFDTQYKAMEPVTSKLDGNSFLDLKLYNTYGRSHNYYIGPEEGKEALKDSEILLDNIYVRNKFVMSVYDRSLYTQTLKAVINDIKTIYESLDSGSITDIHASDIIHKIIDNQPNVRYLRFLGFNDYDANKDSIFVKYSNISDLKEDDMHIYVPEMIRVDEDSVEISEEV